MILRFPYRNTTGFSLANMESMLMMLLDEFSPTASSRMKQDFKNVVFPDLKVAGDIDPVHYMHVIRLKNLDPVQHHGCKGVEAIKDKICNDT
jgi:hypothetical protein